MTPESMSTNLPWIVVQHEVALIKGGGSACMCLCGRCEHGGVSDVTQKVLG